MKIKFTFILIFTLNFLFGQKEIVLRLNHVINDTAFSYNKDFLLNGNLNQYTRLQYYLSSLEIGHDQGQSIFLTNTYVLASGHVNNYYLGNFNISSPESISFDVGVDPIANSGNTTNFSADHPLGPKSPPMDWGWPSGYFFVVTNGLTASTNNNSPNIPFELHALGNQMLTSIDPIYITPIYSNDTIYIDLKVNSERFLSEIDLENAGIDHSSSSNNLMMCSNASTKNVFEDGSNLLTDLNINNDSKNYISLDYTLPFAPTIYYHFQSSRKTNLSITDLNGRIFISKNNLPNHGSYFPLKEFSSGIYILTIENGQERLTKKFNVIQ